MGPTQLPHTGDLPDVSLAAVIVSLLLVVTGLGVRRVGRSI
jgi:LPXTG-motif cell wall-anchored protein